MGNPTIILSRQIANAAGTEAPSPGLAKHTIPTLGGRQVVGAVGVPGGKGRVPNLGHYPSRTDLGHLSRKGQAEVIRQFMDARTAKLHGAENSAPVASKQKSENIAQVLGLTVITPPSID